MSRHVSFSQVSTVPSTHSLSLSSTLAHSLSLLHFFLFFMGPFFFSFFYKVATAGQRTAEAAPAPISEAPHKPQQTTDTQNTAAARAGARIESVTEELPMPRTACQESIRDRAMTVEQPHWYNQLQTTHTRTHTHRANHTDKSQDLLRRKSFILRVFKKAHRGVIAVLMIIMNLQCVLFIPSLNFVFLCLKREQESEGWCVYQCVCSSQIDTIMSSLPPSTP